MLIKIPPKYSVAEIIGFAEVYFRDAAGQQVETVREDGVAMKYEFDGYGNQRRSIDGAGHSINQFFNRRHLVVTWMDANDWQKVFVYNERKRRISYTDAEERTKRFDWGTRDNLHVIYQPENEYTELDHDHNRELIRRETGKSDGADKEVLLWQRNDLSIEEKHTDLSGAEITYTRNFNQQITHEKGEGGDHGVGPDGKKVPNKDVLRFYDEASHEIAVFDEAMRIMSEYELDIKGRRRGELFRGYEGRIYQDARLTWDSNGRLTDFTDTRIKLIRGYTENSDIRFTEAWALEDGKVKILHKVDWFAYNRARLITHDRCELVDQKIVLPKGKGYIYSYDDKVGWRATETWLSSEGKEYVRELFYLANGLLNNTQRSDGFESKDTYNKAYERTLLMKGYNLEHWYRDVTYEMQSVYSANSWMTEQQVYNRTKKVRYFTELSEFDASGHAHRQHTNVYDLVSEKYYVIFDFKQSYVEFDEKRIARIYGSAHWNHNEYPDPHYGAVTINYNPNGAIWESYGNVAEAFDAYITNPDGRIVEKYNGKGDREWESINPSTGEQMASVGNIPISVHAQATSKLEIDQDVYAVSDNWPPPAPTEYTVQKQDETFAEVSEAVYDGDATFGPKIASFNGMQASSDPPQGTPLQIPQDLSTRVHNKANMHPAYNPNKLIGNEYPDIKVPQLTIKPHVVHHHHSFWHMLVEFIVGAVVMLLVPELAGALQMIMPYMLAEMDAAGILGMVSNFAEQFTAVALGDQTSIHLHQIGMTGLDDFVMAGVTDEVDAGLGLNPELMDFSKDFGKELLSQEEVSAIMEGFELATGQVKHFSFAPLVNAIANTVINGTLSTSIRASGAHIPKMPGFLQEFSEGEFDAMFDDAVEDRPWNPEMATAEALGTSLGDSLGRDMLPEHNPELEEYKQQQKETNRLQASAKYSKAWEKFVAETNPYPNEEESYTATENQFKKEQQWYAKQRQTRWAKEQAARQTWNAKKESEPTPNVTLGNFSSKEIALLLGGGAIGWTAIDNYESISKMEKGDLGELAAQKTLQRAGYKELSAKLGGNRGFDGVFVKYGSDGKPVDIIITESKTSQSGWARMSRTDTMGVQGSKLWIRNNILKMMDASDPNAMRSGFLLNQNEKLIRFKGNVLDPHGVNRWRRITNIPLSEYYLRASPFSTNTSQLASLMQWRNMVLGGKLLGLAGAGYLVYEDAKGLYHQYQMSEQTGNYTNTGQYAAKVTGGWSGALFGAEVGGEIGATVGSVFPGPGTVVGGLAGNVIGGTVGYVEGEEGIEDLERWLNKP